MELEFFGAAGEVTGSCHILRIAGRTILLDCGMIQGGKRAEMRNRDAFPFSAGDVDAVVLSHAHLDHSGRLPLLVRRGFKGPIHTHFASKDLSRVLLADAAHLGVRDTERKNRRRRRAGKPLLEPLFELNDAERAVQQMVSHRYHEAFEVTPEVSVVFHDAGHIMGSAVVELRLRHDGVERRLLFSGDLGQYDTPILRDPESLSGIDAVLMESTYGGRTHRSRADTIEELGQILAAARADGGNVLIPAFAIGRSQELLYELGAHAREWHLDDWHVFLDSPMAIEATEVYWDYPHLYDEDATKLRRESNEMPPIKHLHLTRTAGESQVINRLSSGAIILAGSGMCNGGRILHHLKHNLWRPEAHVVIVGFQAPQSLGRKLVERRKRVRIHRESVEVAANIHTLGGLSAHGDSGDLSRWYGALGNTPPVWLVHGEPEPGKALADRLKQDHGARVHRAIPGRRVDIAALADV
ncbi:MAG: MBL fold metallo-hydrolase [Pseudomonadota bacterium]